MKVVNVSETLSRARQISEEAVLEDQRGRETKPLPSGTARHLRDVAAVQPDREGTKGAKPLTRSREVIGQGREGRRDVVEAHRNR